MPRPERRRHPWVVIFTLLSLLAHLLFFLTIVIVSRFLPTPKLKTDTPLTSISLSLEDTPPTVPSRPPPPKHVFFPTDPDKDAQHKETQIESDNDHRLTSKSTVARAPDSLMPDTVSNQKHPANLKSSPNSPSRQPPRPAQTGATSQNKQEQKSSQPPQPSQQTKAQPQQSQKTSATTAQTHTQKTVPPTPSPRTTQQALDANGLPVLPPIVAPTMAPASERQQAQPASSNPEVEEDAHGALGTHGDNSPAAMATELGRYKAMVYRAVGSRWYPKVDKQFQLLPAGLVHIQFTIHKDGTVDTKVLEGDTADLQLLLSISLNSIREASPFPPFTDSMIRDVGDSYTDDFSFSIYGQ